MVGGAAEDHPRDRGDHQRNTKNLWTTRPPVLEELHAPTIGSAAKQNSSSVPLDLAARYFRRLRAATL